MNRGLWLMLAVVGGLSLYLSSQSDDELLASSRQPGAQARASSGVAGGGGANRPSDKRAAPMEPWVADGLTQGIARWQARSASGEGAPVLARSGGASAWRSVQPPPPPRVVVADSGPPPEPTAPPFPHAWVGRFNDEALAPVASGASAVRSPPLVRAVLAGPQSTWVVRAGDVIEGQWRVDRIQDRTMSLTYLPLKQQQTVVMR
ncbi:MAG: hypothetical protein HYX44_16355 [Aquabacterium sp.]|nr:hypothetical protein [Aquabacterium sp.]